MAFTSYVRSSAMVVVVASTCLVAVARSKQTPAPPDAASGTKSKNVLKVPSPMDGVVQFIGTEIKDGEKVAREMLIMADLEGDKRRFRLLKIGDFVKDGQVLARLADDPRERAQLGVAAKKFSQAKADSEVARVAADEARKQWEAVMGRRRLIAEDDLRTLRMAQIKSHWNAVAKAAELAGAEIELRKAQTQIELHEIRSTKSGVLTNIRKRPTETVKALEIILEIEVSPADK